MYFYYSLKSCPVEDLNLSDNGLCRLPDWIGDMKSIRKFSINKNKFTELPERYVYTDSCFPGFDSVQ